MKNFVPVFFWSVVVGYMMWKGMNLWDPL